MLKKRILTTLLLSFIVFVSLSVNSNLKGMDVDSESDGPESQLDEEVRKEFKCSENVLNGLQFTSSSCSGERSCSGEQSFAQYIHPDIISEPNSETEDN